MATLRKNVVTHLYVVHCTVNGKPHDEQVHAESEAVAKAKALRNMQRSYEGIGEYRINSLQRINPDED